MRKIILITTLIILSVTFSNCSKDEAISENQTLNINGQWKNVGYYDDIVNPNSDPNYADNFYLVPNGITITYDNNNYSSTYLGNPYQSGVYSVTNDSLLYYGSEIQGKITKLTSTVIEIMNLQQLGGVRYEKVNSTPTISGKN
ncbi:hypothetical protein OX283_005895 [Flavobacterium sp. SUN052]|uniref:hypothetical protein n=1 Tax=Flavobacterium sp. SUN052 TaxID=3002441 RepID=UPI00237ECC54|nr:hypothetical protein [Flavobacterium sp. SUN052]MEC4004179.1 hypothetical protein [Flavobacterium sp. SUN052]